MVCCRHQIIECEALLVATGRKPNVNNVGLEKAGVEFNAKDGVKVNDQLQTTNKVGTNLLHIFFPRVLFQFRPTRRHVLQKWSNYNPKLRFPPKRLRSPPLAL